MARQRPIRQTPYGRRGWAETAAGRRRFRGGKPVRRAVSRPPRATSPPRVDGNAIRRLRRPLDAIVGIGEHGKAADGPRHHASADLLDTLGERRTEAVS